MSRVVAAAPTCRASLIGGAAGALLLAAGLGSCADRPSTPVPAAQPANRAIARGSAAAPVRLVGTLLVRDSVLSFAACGRSAEHPVQALPSSQLEQALVAVVGGVRDSMYVELVADTAGGTLVVRETLFATSLAEGSRCDRPRRSLAWEALGNEPFWRVTLDGAQLVLERPEPPREMVFEAGPPEVRGALVTIRGTQVLGKVHEIKVGLLREPCRDGMSDAWYPYRAEVRVADLALHGCARR